MLYALAHILRDKLSWLWLLIEKLNSCLFDIRYGKKLRGFSFKEKPEGYEIVPMRDVPTEEMVSFFCQQPEEAFKFFHPHGFDAKSIKRLQQNRSFLAYILRDKTNGKIAGYCFNRSFFHGQGFRGRMVDINYRGKGLGTTMNKILNEVGFGIGLRLFETVSKDNVASYKSALSASNVKVVKELPDNDLYLEILPQFTASLQNSGRILSDILTGGNFGKLNHKAHSSWKYKLETMKVATRNSLKYCSLAPIEAGLLIPRLLLGNLKIIVKKVR